MAKALLNEKPSESKYWLGAKIGTAVHLLLESEIAVADLSKFPVLEGALVEQKIVLGELEGYGTISSKPDLALVKGKHLIDWKTSTRAKVKKLRNLVEPVIVLNGEPINAKPNPEAEYTLKKYMAQTLLYAWGLNNKGIEIDGISLVFINRDGTSDDDIFVYTFEYSRELAESIWTRLETLWTDLQNGVDLDTLERSEYCYKCSIGI